MKLLRKLLGILPILSIASVVLLVIVTFFLGLGKVVVYNYTDCLSGGSCVHVTSTESVYAIKWYASERLDLANGFHIFSFIVLLACLVFSILNIPNKTARGPWLLIAGIATFVIEFLLMIRPIVLINIRTTEGIGDAFEVFDWMTFGFSTLMWFNCIALFVLNKTLFKKVISSEQPKQEVSPEPKAVEEKANSGWYCPECGTKNNGLFCSECGTKKPE